LLDVVGIGEALVQFNPLDEGPIRHAALFEKHVAGSESNVAIGVSRLGHKSALITKLGEDELSRFIISTLNGEGVETKWIKQIPEKNCGIFIVQRNYPVPGRSDVLYYRSDSAARLLSPKDIREDVIGQSKILHISGITPALSDSCKETAFKAIELAHEYKVRFSFDPNYRRKLWSISEARQVFQKMASKAEILFSGVDEAEMILGRRLDPEETLERLSSLGPKIVILKLSAKEGLIAKSPHGRVRAKPYRIPVVDAIGAGDAMVAGFLSGLLSNESMGRCLRMASACAALTVMRKGDFENLPTSEDLEKFLLAAEKGIETDQR
jgi:sugar/nucleoside kinase (ribokinase family)